MTGGGQECRVLIDWGVPKTSWWERLVWSANGILTDDRTCDKGTLAVAVPTVWIDPLASRVEEMGRCTRSASRCFLGISGNFTISRYHPRRFQDPGLPTTRWGGGAPGVRDPDAPIQR